MTDELAGAMQPMMDTLYARWLEEDIDAGLVDPDMFYESQRERQIEDMVQADADTRAGEMRHSQDEPDDEDEEPGYDSDEQEIRDHLGRELGGNPKSAPFPDTAEDEYLEMLADMGLEPHDYEERDNA